MSEQFSSSHIQASSWYQSQFSGHHRRRCCPPPSVAAVAIKFTDEFRVLCASRSATQPCKPRGQIRRHAPLYSSASSRRVKPTRRPPATGIALDLSHKERRLPLSSFQPRVQCLRVILCFLLSTPLGFLFFLDKNGFFWSCFFILWNSHHYYCQTQLEKLYVLVCFRGVMVSRPRIS